MVTYGKKQPTEETMAEATGELPIDRYNREIRELWAKARSMSELPLQELIDTVVTFAARIMGATYNPLHAKDTDSMYSNQEGNRMMLRLKQELATRMGRSNMSPPPDSRSPSTRLG